MSPQEGTAWQVGADASEVLGPESSVFAQLDPVDFGSSVLSVLGRAAGHPDEVGGAWLRFGAAVAEAGPAAVARWLGSNREPRYRSMTGISVSPMRRGTATRAGSRCARRTWRPGGWARTCWRPGGATR